MEKFSTGPGIFTPDGRLSQIEFALEAVASSTNLIAIQTKNGFIIGSDLKNETEVDNDKKFPRNIFLIDKHIILGVTGNIPDSQIIVNHIRLQAQQYRFIYQEDIPVSQIVNEISIIKQQFSQSRSSRPMGCAFILMGWDRFTGLQLIKTDPSGTFSTWKAVSIGSNSVANQLVLDNEFKCELSISEAIGLLVRVTKKKLSNSAPFKNLDVHTYIIDHEKNILIHRLSKKELNSLNKP